MSPHPESVQGEPFDMDKPISVADALDRIRSLIKSEAGRIAYFDDELNYVVAAVREESAAALLRVTTALEEMTQERDRLHVFLADASPKTEKVRQELSAELQRIPTLERDLAALREEHTMYVDIFKRLLDTADVFQSGGEFDGAVPLGRSSIEDGFTWALAEVRRLQAIHAQALREAFEAAWTAGTEYLDWKRSGGIYPGSQEPPDQEEAFAAFLASKK